MNQKAVPLYGKPAASADSGGLRTLERGLAVLELLGADEQGLPLSVIAQRLGLAVGTCHRILRTLVGRGYVEQDPRSRWYLLGLKVLELRGATIRAVQLAAEARPLLRDLMLQAGERAHLALYRDGFVVYVDRVDSQDSLATYIPIAGRAPAHATALGKALLAYGPDDEVEGFLANRPLAGRTPATIVDPDELRRELAATRERGYALDRQEGTLGVGCVAAPIFDYTGRAIAAVSVAGRLERIEGRVPELAGLVRATALAISRRFGFRPSAELTLAELGVRG